PASACLSVAMICVSVNFDVRMEPPDLGTMPERSTYAVSADRGSLRTEDTNDPANPKKRIERLQDRKLQDRKMKEVSN
ncbi:hypothetical protein P2B19_07780, partial [Xanthomonas perforans]